MAKKKTDKKISELLKSRILADGIVVEYTDALYVDLSAVKTPPRPLYRLDNRGYRYYYLLDDKGDPQFFTSVTTMIKNTMPTPPQLTKWLVEQGGDEDEAKERMAYGTYFHAMCGKLLIEGKFSLDDIERELLLFAIGEKIQYREEWVPELKKDILSFAQFLIDHQVKPFGIEILLYHPTDGYAGAIDLVAQLIVEEKGFLGEVYVSGANKGQPKETKREVMVNAIIDIKSGRKGFYESYELQLAAYREMWNIHYPNIPIDKIYNFSPKDWRSTPSYNFKDQTAAKSLKKLPMLVELNRIEEERKENMILSIDGIIDLKKGIADNIKEKSLTDLVKNK